MVGSDFSYNGYLLSDFGYIMVAPENDETTGLKRDLLKGEMNAHRTESNQYGTKYSEELVLNMRIIRSICASDGEPYIDYPMTREIETWVTSLKTPSSLVMSFDSGEPTEYIGVFTDIEPFDAGGIVGFDLTFTCNSPFAYKKNAVKLICADGETTTKIVMNGTDEMDYVYPKITLIDVSGGDISVVNNTDDGKEMKFTLDGEADQYILDCKFRRLLADGEPLTLEDVGWNVENISDYNNVNTGIYKAYWLRLLPGRNELEITGDANWLIEYRTPVKIGGYVDV